MEEIKKEEVKVEPKVTVEDITMKTLNYQVLQLKSKLLEMNLPWLMFMAKMNSICIRQQGI